jgi:hypothetical protein
VAKASICCLMSVKAYVSKAMGLKPLFEAMTPAFLILEVALADGVATVVGTASVGVLAHARLGPGHYYRNMEWRHTGNQNGDEHQARLKCHISHYKLIGHASLIITKRRRAYLDVRLGLGVEKNKKIEQ